MLTKWPRVYFFTSAGIQDLLLFILYMASKLYHNASALFQINLYVVLYLWLLFSVLLLVLFIDTVGKTRQASAS